MGALKWEKVTGKTGYAVDGTLKAASGEDAVWQWRQRFCNVSKYVIIQHAK